jgi:hypothetical protein
MANFPNDAVTPNSSIRRGRALALFLALVAILPNATFADEPPRLDDHDTLLRMKEQIRELQSKVKDLEARPSASTPGTLETIRPSVKLRIFGDVGSLYDRCSYRSRVSVGRSAVHSQRGQQFWDRCRADTSAVQAKRLLEPFHSGAITHPSATTIPGFTKELGFRPPWTAP